MQRKFDERFEKRFEAWKTRYICHFDMGGDAPDPNPGMIASAEASEKVGLESVQLGRDQFEYAKQRNAGLDALVKQVVEQQLGIGDENQQIAREAADRYRNTFVPIEDEMARQAIQFSNAGEQERMVAQAGADVDQAMASSNAAADRNLLSYGINPNSGAFADAARIRAINGAAAKAGAMTNARTNFRNLGFARLQDAASLGRGLPSNATTSYGVSLNAQNSAVGNTVSGNAATLANTDAARGWYNTGLAGIGQAGSIYGADFNARMAGYEADQKANAGLWQGIGAVAGAFVGNPALGAMIGGSIGGKKDGGIVTRRFSPAYADGGGVGIPVSGQQVAGPGTGTSDSIPAVVDGVEPAAISSGEYVIPADVVRMKGVEFFDKLVDKYHQPAGRGVPVGG